MPIYEYHCSSCETFFEQIQKGMTSSDEQAGPPCAQCGSAATRRVVSRVAVLKPASPGVGRAAYPTSWEQTNGGDPETISYWQRRVERERSQESRDSGLTQERSIAAERQWDSFVARHTPDGVVRTPDTDSGASESAGGHGHDHGHAHGHDHGHGHAHPHESTTPDTAATAAGNGASDQGHGGPVSPGTTATGGSTQ